MTTTHENFSPMVTFVALVKSYATGDAAPFPPIAHLDDAGRQLLVAAGARYVRSVAQALCHDVASEAARWAVVEDRSVELGAALFLAALAAKLDELRIDVASEFRPPNFDLALTVAEKPLSLTELQRIVYDGFHAD